MTRHNPFPLLPPHLPHVIISVLQDHPHGLSAIEISRAVRHANPELTISQVVAGVYAMSHKKMVSHDAHVMTRTFRIDPQG
jgi:hypothetical protein